MGPVNRINLNRVKYFDMNEYIKKIDLSDDVLQHLETTSNEFDEYINLLSQLEPNQIYTFLVDSFKKEIENSNCIEGHYINPHEIKNKEVFFNSLNMTKDRIIELHKFAMQTNNDNEYRKNEAYVAGVNPKTKEKTIYWYGAEPKDIDRFMEDFIKIYKDTSVSLKSSNPFLKSALVTLLFIRIHPFGDGNGRTARIIYEMKFTELINKIYGSNLKICPLHISNSILVNQFGYVNRLDDIYFDLEHDSNDEINKWFDFCLSMVDEQIFYMGNELKKEINIKKIRQNESYQDKIKRIEDIILLDEEQEEYVKIYKKDINKK